jgi:tRNA:m(5)U-54 methyltransferase
MKYGAQAAVFRTIPGLENAQFARLGGIHRNTFLNSPTLLDEQMRLRSRPHIRFAGQITGVEGYVESAAMGLIAGRLAAAEIMGHPLPPMPQDSAMGALIHHITGGAEAKTFQRQGGMVRLACHSRHELRLVTHCIHVHNALCPFTDRPAASGACLLGDAGA